MNFALLHALALLAYLAANVLYGANLAIKVPSCTRYARHFLIAGVILHTVGIGAVCLRTQHGPFVTGFGTLSVAAWAVIVLFLPVEFAWRVPVFGVLALPTACVLIFAAFLPGKNTALPSVPSELTHGVIIIHVLLVVVSFALFALAACCAGFYVWQYNILKKPGKRSLFRRLPPLETVDCLAFRLVAFAMPLLTLGLALGIARAAHGELKGNWLLDPHTVTSIVCWLVYGAYIAARTALGWRGTRLNYLLIAGFIVVLAVFFVPSTTHHFS